MSLPSAIPTAQATPVDIRDIRGPVAIGSPWTSLLLLALLASAVALAAFLVWRRRRKAAPGAPPPLPHEVALAGLEAARRLMDPTRARTFAGCVSDVIRQYIDARFGRSAPRSTTDEFLRSLLERPVAELAPHLPALEEFMRQSDLVKFARQPLTLNNMEEMLDTARHFVEQTTAKANDAPVRTAKSS
jgi:hypothetical protein